MNIQKSAEEDKFKKTRLFIFGADNLIRPISSSGPSENLRDNRSRIKCSSSAVHLNWARVLSELRWPSRCSCKRGEDLD